MKVRGGSREMDMMLKAAGAATLQLPSNEIYAAMQTGACDAVDHLVDEPDLVPARGARQAPDHRPRQVLLVHVGAADDVEGDLRRAAEGAAGRDHGGRRRARERSAPTRQGRRRRRSPKVYAKAGAKVADLDDATRRQVARHRARDRLEGLRRQIRELRRAPQAGQRPSREPRLRAGSAARRGAGACRRPAGALDRAHLARVNHLVMIARRRRAGRGVASCSPTASSSRYFLHIPTDWQDETAVFLHRRRDLPVGARRAGAARPCRHRGRGGAACRRASNRFRLHPRRCHEPRFLRLLRLEDPGRCCTRPGSTTSTRPRPGRRRCGFPTR